MQKFKGKLYISGCIYGKKIKEAKAEYKAAQDIINAEGYISANPLTQFYYENWDDKMLSDLKMLSRCTGIVQLEGWEDSVNGCIEHQFAEAMRLDFYTINNGKLEKQ